MNCLRMSMSQGEKNDHRHPVVTLREGYMAHKQPSLDIKWHSSLYCNILDQIYTCLWSVKVRPLVGLHFLECPLFRGVHWADSTVILFRNCFCEIIPSDPTIKLLHPGCPDSDHHVGYIPSLEQLNTTVVVVATWQPVNYPNYSSIV